MDPEASSERSSLSTTLNEQENDRCVCWFTHVQSSEVAIPQPQSDQACTEVDTSIKEPKIEQHLLKKVSVSSREAQNLQQQSHYKDEDKCVAESEVEHKDSIQTFQDTPEKNIEVEVPETQSDQTGTEIDTNIKEPIIQQNIFQNVGVSSWEAHGLQQQSDNKDGDRYIAESKVQHKDNIQTFQDTTENNVETGGLNPTEVLSEDSEQTMNSSHQSDCENKLDAHLLDVIKQFGLDSFYPEKITLIDVIKVCRIANSPRYTDIPWIVLRNIMMINSKSRDTIVEECLERNSEHISQKDQQPNQYDEILVELGILEQQTNVNPLDMLVILFFCSCTTLKSILASKLFMCKLAIPFVLPWQGRLVIIPSILHSIVMDQKMANKGTKQTLAEDIPCHIVSFVRIGNPDVSKSAMINSVLSETFHNTFFNRNCPLGATERTVSDGVVEAAWYIPSGSTTSSMFENITLCLNLRGDGQTHLNQVYFLSRLSSTVVIFLELNALHSIDVEEILNSVQQLTSCGIVLAFDCSKSDQKTIGPTCKDYIEKLADRHQYIKCCIIKQKRPASASDIRKKLVIKINELLKHHNVVSLSAKLTEDVCQNVVKDGDEHCYKLARENATVLLSLIPENCENAINDITPLQGQAWNIWSKHMKTIHKSSKFTSLQERDKYKEEMNRQRQKQLQLCQKRHPFMQMCIQLFFESVDDDTNFTCLVQWTKRLLENRTNSLFCNQLMEYQSHLQQLSKAKDENRESKIVEELDKMVVDSKAVLTNIPFRLEHIVRECGQTYEAMMANRSKLTTDELKLSNGLPKIGAKLLLTGHPFEIMDGDVANVPMLWVHAVLDTLAELVGDKRILALSVVGVQSSGKSTLLNTMFGLQFSTSAGRCTIGVFMQLIPVQQDHFAFDYIFVIDTEGLRAPDQVIDQPFTHDNKLATFVIGLSDIAIVNVKGENTSEVKEILQMVVHAFLRLKVVNKRFNLKQSCIFVHQNVPASDADDKMIEERHLFIETLDRMAKDAAEQENISDVKMFNQVIQFDCERDVNYFSDLWQGDPPMAPVNPGYSQRGAHVKESIIYRSASNNQTYLTILDTKTRIEDLWNGILKDDFVYSFRNTLELKAYSSIERQYHSYVWQLEKFAREFKMIHARKELLTHTNVQEMEKAVPRIMNSLSQKLVIKVGKLGEQLSLFIEKNPLQAVMVQWEQNKLNRLQFVSDELLYQAQSEINTLKEEIRIDKLRNIEKRKHEKACNEMARELAYEMEGGVPSADDMWERFDSMWITWLNRFNVKHINIEDDNLVKDQIENLLRTMFSSLLVYMNLDSEEIERYQTMTKLEGSIHVSNILDEHISVKINIQNDFDGPGAIHAYRRQAIVVTNKILRRIDQKVEEVCCQDVKFDITYAKEIFQLIETATIEHNEEESKQYTLPSTYTAMIVNHVAFYITYIFKKLDDRYKRKHSPTGQLEDYKKTVRAYFKNLVEKETEDMITITFFTEATTRAVVEHVLKLLPIDVEERIYNQFLQEKYQVIKSIMIDLANEGDFNEIMAYIEDPAGYARKWMTNFVYKDIFETEVVNGNVFCDLAKHRIDQIFTQIERSISAVTESSASSLFGNNEGVPASVWIDAFTGDTEQMPLPKEVYGHVCERTICDVRSFMETLIKELHFMKIDAMADFKKFNRHNLQWHVDPILSLMKNIWGCEDKCMFCKEPCKNTDKRHVEFGISHYCIQHRPQGTGGFINISTGKLVVEFCNALIQSDTGRYKFSQMHDLRL